MLRSQRRKFCKGRSRKFRKVEVGNFGRVWSRIFNLRPRNPGSHTSFLAMQQASLYMQVMHPGNWRDSKFIAKQAFQVTQRSNFQPAEHSF